MKSTPWINTMPELSQIRSFNLKIIFLIHFIFISLSSLGTWSSTGYLFYNSILTILLIWAIYHEQSHEPVQLAIVVNACSIVLDILLLVMAFPSNPNYSAREKFSAAMAILHLIIRPFSSIVLIRNLEERSGSTGVLTGILGGGGGGHDENYEDIDRGTVPHSNQGYDFTNAQAI
nr:type-1 angiotensin II receptor-associated protein [Leptinotarsa decemlineata]